ncbi:MAG TPA: amidohydrolase family protein [Armatimonadota bacterium]|jgi:predicted TIM-barrel fold metal-dependent hydrolase|nr:amidohydrolase family protein [Armatimonadota bacterium]HOM82562.1 amidohydrolase family protein [Armatimonadota bacterium]HOQ28228.1 amidohydrolase family protein [Armatimonadota bacterium]HPO72961.1 amidohydrolase family protein [Armatimonadota bacterium]HPT99743.1 amidohydrolase family protein [Armatimonadota bacterium]
MVIDCHAHLSGPKNDVTISWGVPDEKVIADSERLGIDAMCVSLLTRERPATPDGFRECNRLLAEITRRYPGRVLGYAYVNPGYQREAIDEVRRCIEEYGFIGVKLYNEYKCTDPVVWPIVEEAVALRVPILHHAGHSHYFVATQPNMSDGGELAELARRYPEATIICGHVGGGGDWEWTIKAVRPAPNVYLDTSGSVFDAGMIDMAVRILGPERLLFGCDLSYTAGVGKIRAAALDDEARRLVLGGNMQRILAMRGGATC